MDQSNSAKMATTKAPQLAELDTLATKDNVLSPVERHLGLIKAMAIIMAVSMAMLRARFAKGARNRLWFHACS